MIIRKCILPVLFISLICLPGLSAEIPQGGLSDPDGAPSGKLQGYTSLFEEATAYCDETTNRYLSLLSEEVPVYPEKAACPDPSDLLQEDYLELIEKADRSGKCPQTERMGEILYDPGIGILSYFSENRCFYRVEQSDGSVKWGLMSLNGTILTEALFDKVSCFKEGLAAVQADNRLGYINEAGEWELSTAFDSDQTPAMNMLEIRIGNESAGIPDVRAAGEHR